MAFQSEISSIEIISIDSSQRDNIQLRFGAPSGSDVSSETVRLAVDGQPLDSIEVQRSASEDLSVSLVMDISGSMQGAPLAAAKESAVNFVNSLPDSAQISVVSFGNTAQVVQPATGDNQAVISAIQALEAGGETALYDGITTAVGNQSASSRQVVVLLSDGGDTASQGTIASAQSALNGSSSRFYAVALQTDESSSATLSELAGANGEILEASNVQALNGIYSTLATDLSSEFVVNIPVTGADSYNVSLQIPGEGGRTYSWQRDVEVGTEGLSALAEQPQASVEIVADPAFIGAGVTLWVGVGLVLAAVIAAVVAAMSGDDNAPSRAARSFQGGGRSQIDAFNDLRMGATQAVEAALTGAGKKAGLSDKLEAASIKLRVGEFVLISASAAFVGFVLGLAMGGTFRGVLFALVGGFAPRMFIAFKIKRRRKKMGDQLPDLLTLLANALKAGYSLQQAVVATANELEEPLGPELQRVLIESRISGDLVGAMRALVDRAESEDLRWVVDAIDINRAIGGDLVEVLESVGETIRSRITLAAQVSALAAEGKMSAGVLFALPPGLGLVILVVNPAYFQGIWGGSMAYYLSGLELILLGGGAAWLKKMVSGVSL